MIKRLQIKKIHIVKRKGHKEVFDDRKVYGSVYAACLVTGRKEKVCETNAEKVCKSVSEWIKDREETTSHEIFRKVIHELNRIDHKAAFMYETHLDVS